MQNGEKSVFSFLLTRPLRDVTMPDIETIRENRFLLTRPLRDVTTSTPRCNSRVVISTHTPLAGRDVYPDLNSDKQHISTHTPLAGRDDEFLNSDSTDVISTHTPLAGRDHG